MDPVKNPFSPGAGNQPPELAGREEVLSEIGVALRRMQKGASYRSAIFVGLRGVGKTVLLNRAREAADEMRLLTAFIEAHEDKPLPALLTPHLRRILLQLNSNDFSDVTRRALRVLKSFVGRLRVKGSVKGVIDLELGIDPEQGVADSGDLEHDLGDLLVAVAEAAASRKPQWCSLSMSCNT